VLNAGQYELADELGEELGGKWYPLGEWLSSASVFVDPNGWAVATGHGRPADHENPHQHDWEPNPTGGSLKRGGPTRLVYP
jgi:hypothetical protein